MSSRAISIAAVLLSIYFLIQFLWYSQSILIPFIFAVLIWNILCTCARFFQKWSLVGFRVPYSMAILLALASVIGFGVVFVKILTSHMQDMITSSASVQEQFLQWLSTFSKKSSLINWTQSFAKQVNIQRLIVEFYTAVSNFMSSLLLMLLFIVFFFIEQRHFDEKLKAIFKTSKKRQKVLYLLETIPERIQFYLGLKTIFSLLTAATIYIAMYWMGLNYAAFWAASIFLLNFIPNIGPMVITGLITVFSYVQWHDWSKVLLIFGIQLVVHTIIGNFLETHYLGRTLHLSPLVIILSLCFWGMLWGGTGLFLAVPMTVFMMIVLASFKATRPYALMMSEKGELPEAIE